MVSIPSACHVQLSAVLLCQWIELHLLGLPEWIKVISLKKEWNTKHTGCTKEVNSVISFSLQSKLKCINSWCTSVPGFRSYLPCIFSSGNFLFSLFVKCYFSVFFWINFDFMLLVLYLGYISILKIVCLPLKKKLEAEEEKDKKCNIFCMLYLYKLEAYGY